MAGLLAGALAGAIGGGAKAMQWNAQGQIEEKRKRALMALEQEFAMARQDDQQDFTAEENATSRTFRRDERLEGQEFTAGQKAEDRQLSRWQTGVQQAGANSRAAMGRNDWQLLPTNDGGYVRYNTRTGQSEDANLPEGVSAGSKDLTGREKAELDMLGDQLKVLREKQAEGITELTEQELSQMGRLEGRMRGIIGGSRGEQTVLERLLAGEEGGWGDPGPEETQRSADPGSIPGIIERERAARQDTQANNAAERAALQARDQADAVLERMQSERVGGHASPLLQDRFLSQNGGLAEPSPETMTEAEQVAEQLLALDANANLSADQKRWIAERLMRLQDAGVPINLEQ